VLITGFTRTRHWSLYRTTRIQSTSTHPISLRSILISSYYLRLRLPNHVSYLVQQPINYSYIKRNPATFQPKGLWFSSTEQHPKPVQPKSHPQNLSPYSNNETSHEDIWGSGGIAPSILNLGTRWRWVIAFKLRPLHPPYQLDRSLCGLQSQSRHSGEEANSMFQPGIEPRSSSP
jgi:hypothetical protein